MQSWEINEKHAASWGGKLQQTLGCGLMKSHKGDFETCPFGFMNHNIVFNSFLIYVLFLGKAVTAPIFVKFHFGWFFSFRSNLRNQIQDSRQYGDPYFFVQPLPLDDLFVSLHPVWARLFLLISNAASNVSKCFNIKHLIIKNKIHCAWNMYVAWYLLRKTRYIYKK